MISQSSVDRWIERPLKDSRKAKLFSDAELDERIARLRVQPKFVTKPDKHQKVCFLLTCRYPGYNLWLDAGGGKSKVLLDAIRYRRRTKEIKHALVLVPATANLYEWESEVKIHQPSFSCQLVDGTGSAQRERQLYSGARVTVATYAGLLSLCCARLTRWRGNKKVTEWVPDWKKVRKLIDHFGFLGMDETSVYLRNHQSLCFRILKHFFLEGAFVYGLTGTSFDDRPEDMWSQFFLVDGGETLGRHLNVFRSAFCRPVQKKWGFGVDWKFKPHMEPQLNRMIAHRSIRYEDHEMADLPPLVGAISSKRGPNIKPVLFTKEIIDYYDKLVKELSQAGGNFTLVESVFNRMRYITAGYLAVKDPEGERISVKFKNNPKMDALLKLLGEIPKKRKVIIYVYYRMTGDLVMERLKAAKIGKVVGIYGRGSKTSRRAAMKAFKEGDAKYLVLSTAGAYGLNFQKACRYGVFYETPTSGIERRQMQKRIHRRGQLYTTFLFDLVVRKSIDEKIIKALIKGADLFEMIVGGKKRGKAIKRLRLVA